MTNVLLSATSCRRRLTHLAIRRFSTTTVIVVLNVQYHSGHGLLRRLRHAFNSRPRFYITIIKGSIRFTEPLHSLSNLLVAVLRTSQDAALSVVDASVDATA